MYSGRRVARLDKTGGFARHPYQTHGNRLSAFTQFRDDEIADLQQQYDPNNQNNTTNFPHHDTPNNHSGSSTSSDGYASNSNTHALLHSTNIEDEGLLTGGRKQKTNICMQIIQYFKSFCTKPVSIERTVVFSTATSSSTSTSSSSAITHGDGFVSTNTSINTFVPSSSSRQHSSSYCEEFSQHDYNLAITPPSSTTRLSKASITTEPPVSFPANVVRNQKYSILSFLPLFLYNEFRFFFNLYFLLVALSQFISVLRVGFLFTYIAPLVMVLVVSMTKELYDDFLRFSRDRTANNEKFNVLLPNGQLKPTPSRELKVGSIIVLKQNERVPCDCILLRTHDKQGTAFIRTDQLDGETDWKIRRAIPVTQAMNDDIDIFSMNAKLRAESPRIDIYQFYGSFTYYDADAKTYNQNGLLTDGEGISTTAGSTASTSPTTTSKQATRGKNKGKGGAKGKRRGGERGENTSKAHGHGTPLKDAVDMNTEISHIHVPSSPMSHSDFSELVDHYEGNTSLISTSNTVSASGSGSGVINNQSNTIPNLNYNPFLQNTNPVIEPLSLENAVWGNTVVASSQVVLCVIYTGTDTRSSMNASTPKTKIGLVDDDINYLSKILFILTIILALTMTILNGFSYSDWYIYMFRMVLLFSSIIPISLRVNLDMGKLLYANFIEKDQAIPETIVRTSTIPEELGRISYVFTDKTGTLTRNVMKFKTLQLAPPVGFNIQSIEIMKLYLKEAFLQDSKHKAMLQKLIASNQLQYNIGLGAGNISASSGHLSTSTGRGSGNSSGSGTHNFNSNSNTNTPAKFINTGSLLEEHEADRLEKIQVSIDSQGRTRVHGNTGDIISADTDNESNTSVQLQNLRPSHDSNHSNRDSNIDFDFESTTSTLSSTSTTTTSGNKNLSFYLDKTKNVQPKSKSKPVDGVSFDPTLNTLNLEHDQLDTTLDTSVDTPLDTTLDILQPQSQSQSQSQPHSERVETALTNATIEDYHRVVVEREKLQKQFDALGSNTTYVSTLTRDAILAIALCNNVTPVFNEETNEKEFQASSPDEVALVQFASSIGVDLIERDMTTITLATPIGTIESFDILQNFPFTSESKRMGIVVRSRVTGIITYYVKGAESVMIPRVVPSNWIEEEVANLARIGLRTLVFAKKILTNQQYQSFSDALYTARATMTNRDSAVGNVLDHVERGMTLVGLTGVEDRLQDNVRVSLELLRNAGVKIWMLTGDKAETAACIGVSARLIDRGQTLYHIQCNSRTEALEQLEKFSTLPTNACLMIDGNSLSVMLDHYPFQFIDIASQAPAVICCRCSPTQKAEVVKLVRNRTQLRTLAIGDGGNDVAMIQSADVGIGIVGKEGKQASMAADFSIMQFSYLVRLMLWHGRTSFKRSARLALFVMHRGLIISIMQCVFSALFFFVAVPIYTGWLMVGYSTIFTMLPVFSQVLDEDVNEKTAFLFPELYTELQLGRPLSMKKFMTWVFLSIYQGGLIIILSMILFDDSFTNIVGITFSSLIVCELANVALSITRWKALMVWSFVISIAAYLFALVTLRSYFDIIFIFSWQFLWKVALITMIVTFPPAIIQWAVEKYSPSAHTKVDIVHTKNTAAAATINNDTL